MPRERTTRRKSIYVKPKYDPALGPPPEAMEKDDVESLYADQRTHYKAPEDRELETLFEGKDADNEGNAEDRDGNGGGRRPKRKVSVEVFKCISLCSFAAWENVTSNFSPSVLQTRS